MKKSAIAVAVLAFLATGYSQSLVRNKEQRIASIKLEKELTLGDNSETKEPLFQSIRSLRVDDKGNIYVLDVRAAKLTKFGNDGKVIYSVGRKGQGPGEFMIPSGIELTKDNSVLIFDLGNQRVIFLSAATGELLEEKSTARWPRLFRVDVDTQGFFYGYMVVYEEEKTKRVIYKFSPDFELIKEIYKLDDQLPGKEIRVFSPNLLFRLLDNDGLLIANSQEYTFYEYSTAGDLIRTIQNDYRPVPITEADKERELKARSEGAPAASERLFVFPDSYPPIEQMITDNKDNIFIRRYQTNKAGNTYYEAFNKEGKPLGKFPLPFPVICIVDDRMYSLESDQAGFNQICRYKFRIIR